MGTQIGSTRIKTRSERIKEMEGVIKTIGHDGFTELKKRNNSINSEYKSDYLLMISLFHEYHSEIDERDIQNLKDIELQQELTKNRIREDRVLKVQLLLFRSGWTVVLISLLFLAGTIDHYFDFLHFPNFFKSVQVNPITNSSPLKN